MEYISSLIVTMIVMYIGVQSIIGSIRVIIHPDAPPWYTVIVIIVMSASMLGKAAYGIVMRCAA